MATSTHETGARTAKDVRLEAIVTAEVQNALQDEVPKLAGLLAKRVYEKVRKWSEKGYEEEEAPSEEEYSPAKRGKTYHLTVTEDEEDIRETLRKPPRCFRCKKNDHAVGDCIFGKKVCYYCNRMGHSYDDCIERMVTKREVIRDPYYPEYDPWVNERIQYQ